MSTTIHDVAVIGAGISGLSAARRLVADGKEVVLLDKSRGVGGRAATRRLEAVPGVTVPVDHGAQFFTARDPRFRELVARWQEERICFPWAEEFSVWENGVLRDSDPERREIRYACRGGMSLLGKKLAEGLPVIREFEVSSVLQKDGVWELRAEGKDPCLARAIFVSAPLPQAFRLIGEHLTEEERRQLGVITYDPCVAVMAWYPEGTAVPSWHGIQIRDSSSSLAWIAWDSSRREESISQGVAVLHGSGAFSNRWLDASKEELRAAGEELLAESAAIVGEWLGKPVGFMVHRWKFAHPRGEALPGGFLKASSAPLWLIGDGLNGGRLEGAWLSGLAAAEDLLGKNRS